MNEHRIKIEKGIPPPAPRLLTGVGSVLSKMEVGDSFVIEDNASLRANVYPLAHRLGMKVSVRTLVGGKIRVWRVE